MTSDTNNSSENLDRDPVSEADLLSNIWDRWLEQAWYEQIMTSLLLMPVSLAATLVVMLLGLTAVVVTILCLPPYFVWHLFCRGARD